jgi:hypothetical protein
MDAFTAVKKLLLKEVRADRVAAFSAFLETAPTAIDVLKELISDSTNTSWLRLQAIDILFSVPTRLSRLNESAAARDNALAKVRQAAVDLVRARVDEKKETSFLIKEDKRLARRLKKAKKEDEEINPMMEVHVL